VGSGSHRGELANFAAYSVDPSYEQRGQPPIRKHEESKMTTFRVRVFEQNGNWFFRWDNVAVPTACGITSPLASREDSESERQTWMETEKKKRPWAVFELD
jgi:hypothetical protein